jgi:cell division septation protein DedD
MSEDVLTDDQSHYEISLTAGQAFVAFVLLLLSLAASFAFGLLIGKGQADERLVVRKEPSVVSEASALPKKSAGTIVELGVAADDFKKPDAATTTAAPLTESVAPLAADSPSTETPAPAVVEAPKPVAETPKPVAETPKPVPAAATGVPFYAQLISTTDKNTAETLAAKLIDRGYNSAYVERGANEKGPIYRVRVKFSGETEARAAEPKLREFSKEVWITR